MKQYIYVSTEEHTVLTMQIYIDSLTHDNPIIKYRYGDINRLPSMRITYYNGNRMRSSHTPFTKKNKNNRKISPLITNRLKREIGIMFYRKRSTALEVELVRL